MRGRWGRTGGVGEHNIPGKKCVGSNPRHSGSHVPANQSATLANLSPNDQRHITTRTGSSSPARFGKSQTGMPRVYTSTKASVLEPNGLPFKLPLFEIYTCKHTTNGANLCWETPHKRYIQASWGQKTLNESRGATRVCLALRALLNLMDYTHHWAGWNDLKLTDS